MTSLGGQSISGHSENKLSIRAEHALLAKKKADGIFYVVANDLPALRHHLLEEGIAESAIIQEFARWNGILLEMSYAQVRNVLVSNPLVRFIDVRNVKPHPERAVRGLDLSVNKLNLLHERYPFLNGEGMAVSIKENAFDSTDIDLQERYLPSPLRDRSVNNHANNVATMAVGGGNTFYTGKGAAWGADVSTSSFRNLFPDASTYFLAGDISVQNHSYGVGIENYYGGESMAYDEQSARLGSFLHVFSAGNQGEQVSELGNYAGVETFANLTGNMKMAKNLLVVGAIDTALRVDSRSSRGPAYDGRVKPELVAFGQDGSSGAAAIVSGSALLLQQAYLNTQGDLPPVGLLRAVLLNSADDIGAAGPDFISGYGNLDANGGVRTLLDGRYFSATIAPGEDRRFTITVPENAINLKVTLAWIDPAAAPNAPRALVNDLDLTLEDESTTSITLPWVLNSFPHRDSLAKVAVRGRDSLNNQEQIFLPAPVPGEYSLLVRGQDLMTEMQDFYLAYEWEVPAFRWNFPLRNDPLVAGEQTTLRWERPEEDNGRLEYRLLSDEEWLLIDQNQPLASGYRSWSLPDTSALVQFRMRVGDEVYLSDTAAVSHIINLEVVYDCEEELGLSWNGGGPADEYRLYGLAEGTMEAFETVADTFVALDKSVISSSYLSIAPGIDASRFGLRSPTINLAFQFAGCYVRNFLADLRGEVVNLRLTLGSLYRVERVIIEKWDGSSFVRLEEALMPNETELTFEDADLVQGPNTYRARVIRADARESLSEPASVLFAGQDYFLFPNPTTPSEGAGLVIRDLPADAEFLLYSSIGRLILRLPLRSDIEEIPVQGLTAGIYPYRINSAGKQVFAGKLIVR